MASEPLLGEEIRRQLRDHAHQQTEGKDHPLGWFSDDEGRFYLDVVRRHPNGILVELGIHLGRSLSYILQSCRELDVKIHAVDLWIDVAPDAIDEKVDWIGGSHRWERFNKNLERMGGKGYVNVIRMDSVEAAEQFKDNSVDVVFIDTLHTYERTKKELKAWWPKLKKHGEMLGHDYSKNDPGLVKAVDERFGKPDLVKGIMWLVVKK